MAEGASSWVHILFISAAVAEGGILHQGYLLWLYCGEIPHIVFTVHIIQARHILVEVAAAATCHMHRTNNTPSV